MGNEFQFLLGVPVAAPEVLGSTLGPDCTWPPHRHPGRHNQHPRLSRYSAGADPAPSLRPRVTDLAHKNAHSCVQSRQPLWRPLPRVPIQAHTEVANLQVHWLPAPQIKNTSLPSGTHSAGRIGPTSSRTVSQIFGGGRGQRGWGRGEPQVPEVGVGVPKGEGPYPYVWVPHKEQLP